MILIFIMVFYIRVHLHRSFVLSYMSISQSLSIGDSVYESDWLDADLMSKKFILFIIVRSRRRVCLRAETFSIVSLQSFGSVRVAIVFYPTFVVVAMQFFCALDDVRCPVRAQLSMKPFILFSSGRSSVPATHISRYYGKCTMDQQQHPSHHWLCRKAICNGSWSRELR